MLTVRVSLPSAACELISGLNIFVMALNKEHVLDFNTAHVLRLNTADVVALNKAAHVLREH